MGLILLPIQLEASEAQCTLLRARACLLEFVVADTGRINAFSSSAAVCRAWQIRNHSATRQRRKLASWQQTVSEFEKML